MSNTALFRFQPPQGLGWSVIRRPKFQTQVQDSVSKVQQLRISDQQLWPMWEYEFIWNYLKGGAENSPGTLNAFQQLIGYYMARMNTFNNSNNDSFLYEDPNHNQVGTINTPDNSHVFATGDGSTTKFQLQRRVGSGFDIVQNVNGDGSFYTTTPTTSPIQLYKFGFEGIKNLIANSQQIGGSLWLLAYANFSGGPILQGPVVTQNAAFAPDGSCTATKIVMPTGPSSGDAVEVYNFIGTPEYGGILGGRTFTFSVWLRADAGVSNPLITLTFGDNVSVGFSLNCQLTSQWQRFVLTGTFAGGVTTTTLVAVIVDNTLNTPANFYAWGPQLEENSTATAYQPTGSVNRWGPVYQVSTTRTNLLKWSTDFTNAVWSNGGTGTTVTSGKAAPDGSTNAQQLNSGTTDSYSLQSVTGLSNFFVTFSVWLRCTTGTINIPLTIRNTASTVTYGQSTKTLTTKWQRFTVSGSITDGTIQCIIAGFGSYISASTAIQMFAPQLENWGSNGLDSQGRANPYPWSGTAQDGGTSYIPTTSAGVTVQDYTLDSVGNVNFGSAPANNALLSWAGKYLMRLHFSDDSIDVEEFMFQLHTLRKLKMESVII